MSREENEIQEKLMALELSIKDDSLEKAPAKAMSKEELDSIIVSGKKKNADDPTRADLYLLGSIALFAAGILMLFSHIRVGTLVFWGVGSHLGGFLLIPLFVGLGMLIYNYKSRTAQIVTAASVGLVLFSVLAQLVITFPMVSMLEMIFLVLPVVAGIALFAKYRQASKQLESKSSE